eukprot:CAMPEP_0113323854 /NCGR_PEP_ID=MMETSP0010_2-20120614/16620_1 /TAXON_ID=216773 ORGANISM="Corethron hystrix, Strain 308" /NCGR_SAMPLE_ID=MMETSP0010_2 /ASSEMBLY_ACC=CAM_ASM_000155 /LENGTH=211 /DNA_ID=CAMNT_0000182967 /DNA_START=136 /DNA_END=768 /DNA_ORIENTATION=- /assembly_acc=CAM_ASM_000155
MNIEILCESQPFCSWCTEIHSGLTFCVEDAKAKFLPVSCTTKEEVKSSSEEDPHVECAPLLSEETCGEDSHCAWCTESNTGLSVCLNATLAELMPLDCVEKQAIVSVPEEDLDDFALSSFSPCVDKLDESLCDAAPGCEWCIETDVEIGACVNTTIAEVLVSYLPTHLTCEAKLGVQSVPKKDLAAATEPHADCVQFLSEETCGEDHTCVW